MLKLAIAGFTTVVFACGTIWGYTWYRHAPEVAELGKLAANYASVKSDFISIPIFDAGKVKGYVTFRANIELTDEAFMAEAGYIISDVLHRKLPIFSQMFATGVDQKTLSTIEAPLLDALVSRLGVDKVGSIQLTEIAFDRRI